MLPFRSDISGYSGYCGISDKSGCCTVVPLIFIASGGGAKTEVMMFDVKLEKLQAVAPAATPRPPPVPTAATVPVPKVLITPKTVEAPLIERLRELESLFTLAPEAVNPSIKAGAPGIAPDISGITPGVAAPNPRALVARSTSPLDFSASMADCIPGPNCRFGVVAAGDDEVLVTRVPLPWVSVIVEGAFNAAVWAIWAFVWNPLPVIPFHSFGTSHNAHPDRLPQEDCSAYSRTD